MRTPYEVTASWMMREAYRWLESADEYDRANEPESAKELREGAKIIARAAEWVLAQDTDKVGK